MLSFTAAPGESRGYLLVSTNGGLNQMRAGVINLPMYILFMLHSKWPKKNSNSDWYCLNLVARKEIELTADI